MKDDHTPRVIPLRAVVDEATARARKLVAIAPVMIGLSLMAGGDHRFLAPGFAVAHRIASGPVWGVVFLVPGVFMVAFAWDLRQKVFWAAVASTFLFAFWTVTLIASCVTTSNDPTPAAFTGPAVYGWVTICMAATAARDSDRFYDLMEKIKAKLFKGR